MKPKKKLTKRARKKELTGINLAAIYKRLEKVEQEYLICYSNLKRVFARVVALEKKK